jgi:formylglycine-generating enzyme required for sulfatase activity
MAGNVAEWTRSLEKSYPYDVADGRESLDASGARVVRGGAFGSTDQYVRAAYRLRFGPGFRHNYIGFRVVVSPFFSDL